MQNRRQHIHRGRIRIAAGHHRGTETGAGFTTGTPWLAVNPDHTTVNAAAQVGVPGSVFEHYRRLIALRHEDPVVTDGDFELLLPDHPAIWAFLRRTPEAELLVAANFSAEVTGVRLPLGSRMALDVDLRGNGGGYLDPSLVHQEAGQQPGPLVAGQLVTLDVPPGEIGTAELEFRDVIGYCFEGLAAVLALGAAACGGSTSANGVSASRSTQPPPTHRSSAAARALTSSMAG